MRWACPETWRKRAPAGFSRRLRRSDQARSHGSLSPSQSQSQSSAIGSSSFCVVAVPPTTGVHRTPLRNHGPARRRRYSVGPTTKAPVPLGGRGLRSRSWYHHHSPSAQEKARWALCRAVAGANRGGLLVRGKKAQVHLPAQGCHAEGWVAALAAFAPLSAHRSVSVSDPVTATVVAKGCQPHKCFSG